MSQAPSVKLDIKNAVVQLKILPLLLGKFKTGAIQIDQLTLNQQDPLLTIQLKNIRLKSSITDQLNNSFFTNLSFNFAKNNLPLSGYAVISGHVTVDWKNDYYFIKNTILNVFMTNNNKTLRLTTTGDMIIDIINQTAAWKNFNSTLSDLSINGELNAKNILSDPVVSGHFTLRSSHIKKIFDQIDFFNIKTENIPDINDINADVHLFANNKSFNIQSNLHIKNIQMSKINIDDINCRLYFKNNILNIKSIHANLYGGFLNGEATINLESFLPIMTANVKTYNIQIEPLFKLIQAANADINPNTKIVGTGNIELDISTSGADGQSILNNLTGTSHVRITNGILMGKDWDDTVNMFVAANNAITQHMISQNFRVFRFKQLSCSFKINNGIFLGEDLLIESSDIMINGKGNINLPNNLLDYELRAEFKNILPYDGIYNNSAKTILATILFRGPLTQLG